MTESRSRPWRVKSRPDCLWCGTKLKDRRSKYCNTKCGLLARREVHIQAWLNGEWQGTVSNVRTSGHIKNYLIDLRGDACERCGWSEVNPFTNKVPIQLDHINGDPLDNRIDNLRLLCPSCHSLTATYGGANKGRGRMSLGKKQ